MPLTRSFAAAGSRWATKSQAPSMVYIAGEEMTHYASQLVVDEWIKPYFDTEKWQHFDLSCVSRDKTDDKVLHDAVAAGAEVGAIFKEPTITPTKEQVEEVREREEYVKVDFFFFGGGSGARE